MTDVRVLIAAAGEGKRAGLPYPKTLHEVLGKPIIVRLIELLRPIDSEPAIIISPTGRAAIEGCLEEHGLHAVLIEQSEPSGMGDAVLHVRNSPGHSGAETLLLVWGDIPLIEPETVAVTLQVHRDHANVLTFPTRYVDAAYTIVERDEDGNVLSLVETREAGVDCRAGERDIGLFAFKPDAVLEVLDKRADGALGRHTGEHGFLYVIRCLVEQGCRVEALPIATEREIISLNRLTDLNAIPLALSKR